MARGWDSVFSLQNGSGAEPSPVAYGPQLASDAARAAGVTLNKLESSLGWEWTTFTVILEYAGSVSSVFELGRFGQRSDWGSP